MAVTHTPHFITAPDNKFVSHAFHLPDEEYGRALDCLVKATTDVVIRRDCDGSILLGRRRIEPQPDWWFIGGRMRPGETVSESAARHLKRDVGFVVPNPNERILTVGTYSFVWQLREAPPKTNGTCDISTILTITVSDDDIATFKPLCEEEYADSKWLSEDEILTGSYAPALKQAISDLQTQRIWIKLQNATDDGEILELVKKLRESNK